MALEVMCSSSVSPDSRSLPSVTNTAQPGGVDAGGPQPGQDRGLALGSADAAVDERRTVGPGAREQPGVGRAQGERQGHDDAERTFVWTHLRATTPLPEKP